MLDTATMWNLYQSCIHQFNVDKTSPYIYKLFRITDSTRFTLLYYMKHQLVANYCIFTYYLAHKYDI